MRTRHGERSSILSLPNDLQCPDIVDNRGKTDFDTATEI